MTKPRVAVVIPCFNHGQFLPEAIASVQNPAKNDVEVIIVDDGSTDVATQKEVDSLARGGLHVIRQPNKGLAASRNAGIAASQAEYILPLDADDRLRSAWLDRGIALLDSNPKVGVVYGDLEFFGTRNEHWKVGEFDLERLLQANFIPCCALFRRAIWEQNQGYDGTMPVQGYEDWDFWLGAAEHGWSFAYLPEVFFEYRQTGQSMLTHARQFERETADFVAKKHGPLYRRVWLPYLHERLSVKLALRHLAKVIAYRLRARFRGAQGPPPRPEEVSKLTIP